LTTFFTSLLLRLDVVMGGDLVLQCNGAVGTADGGSSFESNLTKEVGRNGRSASPLWCSWCVPLVVVTK
jgi:hypothetical protein